jgi:hypothetical protein
MFPPATVTVLRWNNDAKITRNSTGRIKVKKRDWRLRMNPRRS